MKELIILGAGGHGRVVADIAMKSNIYEKISFLDDKPSENSLGIPVIGSMMDYKKWISSVDFFDE